MAKRKRKEQPRKKGAARMRQLGYAQVTVWFSPDELELVRAVAGASALATWIKVAAIGRAHNPGGGVRIERRR